MKNIKPRSVKLVCNDDRPEDSLQHLCHPCPLRLNERSATTTGDIRVNYDTGSNYLGINYTRRLESCHPLVNCLGNKFEEQISSRKESSGNYHSKMSGNKSPKMGSSLVNIHPPRFVRSQSPKRYNHHSMIPRLFRLDHLTTLVALLFVSGLINYAQSDTQLSSNLCPLSSCMCKWSGGKQVKFPTTNDVDASCERRNLQVIPMQLPSETQVLDMSYNPLNQLQSHIFRDRRLTNLQRLKLSDCKISHIADDAFAQLTNLVELDLQHNLLQQVPTRALELLRYSLRKLVLAHNPIHVLNSATFSPLSHINTLDLSYMQISHLMPNAFSGLKELRELKLSENNLTQLPLNVLVDLPDSAMIHLYGNPWHCDCELRQSIEWMHKHQIRTTINPTCATPSRHKDIRWQNVRSESFMCPPVILNKPETIVVGAGSNVTLTCSARGNPPLTFVWFQDEKNITSNAGSANQSEPPPSTKLLEERRYEIQEELTPPNITTSILFLMNLKLTDTSVFLCWVENGDGYTIGNYSLIVNDSPPTHLSDSWAAGQAIRGIGNSLGHLIGVESSQILIFLLALSLLLAAILICLFILKHVTSSRSSKSSSESKSDLKSQKIKTTMSSADKFSNTNGKTSPNGQMFASSDEDGLTDDEDDEHSSSGASSSGSQSSCNKKNTRVLAASDLDGFIEHMRSGIINMDYHSMSPVTQFNNNTLKSSSQSTKDQKQHHQLTHLNHFQSSSNASSQQAFYCSQPSNGSNSMATTLSDLSPSSGSASTSFANNNQTMTPQQQQYIVATTMANHLIGHPSSTTNCDFSTHQLNSQQEMATAAHHYSDYPGGYGDDPGAPQLMPTIYTGPGVYPQMHGHNQTAMINHYPVTVPMNGVQQSSNQNVAMHDMVNHNRLSNGSVQMQQQHQAYQMQDPTGPFTHIL